MANPHIAWADLTVRLTVTYHDTAIPADAGKSAGRTNFLRSLIGRSALLFSGHPVNETTYASGPLLRRDIGSESRIYDSKKGTVTIIDRDKGTALTVTTQLADYIEGSEPGAPDDVSVHQTSSSRKIAGHNAISFQGTVKHGADPKQIITVWSTTDDIGTSNALESADLFRMAGFDHYIGLPGSLLSVSVQSGTSTITVEATTVSADPIDKTVFDIPTGYKPGIIRVSRSAASQFKDLTNGKRYNSSDADRALIQAAGDGDMRGVTRALTNGADLKRAVDQYGHSALTLAAANRHWDVVKLLVEQGADVNAADQGGYTALWCASQAGDVDTVQLLLEHHADPNMPDNDEGDTAIVCAAQYGRSKVIPLLIAHGASLQIANSIGQTAVDAANDGYHPITLKLLQDAFAAIK